MIVDAENLILGRLTSSIAKKALLGEKIDINLEETSDPTYYEESETNMYALNFSLLTTYDGRKVTRNNPLPVENQNPQ